jgi:hypothetical protein
MEVNWTEHRSLCVLAWRLGGALGAEALGGAALRWATTPLLLGPGPTPGQAGRGGWTLGELVVAAVAAAAWVLFAWVVTTTVLTVLMVLLQRVWAPTPRAVRLAGPLWWRRALLGACGLSLAAPVAVAGPAHVIPAQERITHRCVATGRPSCPLAGLGFPDLPDAAPGSPGHRHSYVVRPGDCLWSIARLDLPPSAPDGAVAREVAALYAANRVAIGPDPDLIHPGTPLTRPGGIA